MTDDTYPDPRRGPVVCQYQSVPRRIRLAIAGLFLLGIGGFVAAALVGGGNQPDITVTSNEAVDGLIPERGAEVLQQQRVGIDLAPPYELVSLRIFPNDRFTGGIEVADAVTHVDGLNQFVYLPGEGRPVPALSPDTNCVIVTYVEVARPDVDLTIDWCFEVA